MSDDIFRWMPLRFIGYSFGLAEAAKYGFHSRIVLMCQGVGTIFVVCHVAHTGINTKLLSPVLNSLGFEALCTCIVPPMVTYYVCGMVAEFMWDKKSLPFSVRRIVPFLAGIFTLPVIMYFVDPELDNLVDYLIPIE